MLLGDDKKGNRGWRPGVEGDVRSSWVVHVYLGTIDFVPSFEELKTFIAPVQLNVSTTETNVGISRQNNKMSFWNLRPVTSEVLNFSQQCPISSVSPPPPPKLPEEGGGRAGPVEQKAKRLGKLSTRRCEPDLWMQIQ